MLQDVERVVTVIMATVVGLTFLFGFGNVLNLALRLGVPIWVAPLIAPAVDLSVLGLLLATRHLAVRGATVEVLRPLRRFTLFVSAVTLALNIADPLLSGDYGKAAFDAVGPVLLIGWAEVGPGMLQAIAQVGQQSRDEVVALDSKQGVADVGEHLDDLELARLADARHWALHRRPIAADTLRTQLKISMERARELVVSLRAELAELVVARVH
ncbi:hypothetical protein ABZX92_32430 [Lentzea sp. NPDC006480]|uniref:hypothetical protein n=1 Tax=Lentzea sp. NPDC006480 TaxID=3157176 RepID=UPI0033B7D28C